MLVKIQAVGFWVMTLYSLDKFARTEAVHSSKTLTHKQGTITHNTIWNTKKMCIVWYFVTEQ
jgi:hypothetical protein